MVENRFNHIYHLGDNRTYRLSVYVYKREGVNEVEKQSLVKNTYNGLVTRLGVSNQYIYLQNRNGDVDKYNCEFNPPVSTEEIEKLINSKKL